MKFKKSYFRILLSLIGIFIFVINGCRKPEDDPDDGGITPMYGVRESTFQKSELKNDNAFDQKDSTINF